MGSLSTTGIVLFLLIQERRDHKQTIERYEADRQRYEDTSLAERERYEKRLWRLNEYVVHQTNLKISKEIDRDETRVRLERPEEDADSYFLNRD